MQFTAINTASDPSGHLKWSQGKTPTEYSHPENTASDPNGHKNVDFDLLLNTSG